jgi:hypothetical protein
MTFLSKEILIRMHGELKQCSGGGWDACVMAGKRCIEQTYHPNEKSGREHLSKKWCLEPK